MDAASAEQAVPVQPLETVAGPAYQLHASASIEQGAELEVGLWVATGLRTYRIR